MRSAGPAPGAERQFIISTDHLFPNAAETTQEAVPEFSLEDFESRCHMPRTTAAD